MSTAEKVKRHPGQSLTDRGSKTFISKQYSSKVAGTEFPVFSKALFSIGAHCFPLGGVKETSGYDLRLTVPVYQVGAGVSSSKKSSPEGLKSEIREMSKSGK